LTIGFLVFYLTRGGKLEGDVQVRDDYRRLYQSIELVQEIWTTGLRDKVKDYLTLCPEEKSLTEKCSLNLLNCLSKSEEFSNQQAKINIVKELVTKASHHEVIVPFSESIEIEIRNKEASISVFLEKSCNEIYLPRRMYALEDTTSRKYSWWDNFKRHFILQTDTVSVGDVKRWLKYDTSFKQGDEILKSINSKLKDDSPILNLKYEEMERFCSFHGKQIMSVDLFDAASMHPGDLSTDRMKFPLRSIWPWDYKKKVGLIWEYRSGKKDKVELDDCKKVFSSECLKVENVPNREGVYTWSGLRSVLGGEMEVFRNSLYPRRNLKASSHYFDLKSNWHELGRRAYWDGLGLALHNFNFRFEDPSEVFNQFGVTFRCAREVLE
jgi:hypothetical protein